jgi:hypothetical protein
MNEADKLSWKLSGTRVFTVKSMYEALQNYSMGWYLIDSGGKLRYQCELRCFFG